VGTLAEKVLVLIGRFADAKVRAPGVSPLHKEARRRLLLVSG
jgi:hypothetical protein